MKLKPVDLIHVELEWQGTNLPVGRIAVDRWQIYFEYDSSFIDQGLELSPFKLPLRSGVFEGEQKIFDGLFGLFNDSLPDGWGKLLLDRAVTEKGIPYQSLSPLDRLAHVGHHGMGALIYKPNYHDTNKPSDQLSLDQLHTEMKEVLAGDAPEVVEKLLALNGSSAGARPKVLVGYEEKNHLLINGQQKLPGGFEHWMVKFASSSDQSDIGNIEYAYALMAKNAGIEMPETKLFEGQYNRSYFGVKRFDRKGNARVHTHTASGLLHANHQIPSLDYENLMRSAIALCKDIREAEKVFRLAAFNVLAHNRDDHSKNFSFIMREDGRWGFAPAYDLTFSYGPNREHSALVMGEGRNPGTKQLFQLAEKFQLNKADTILSEVRQSIAQWPAFATAAQVPKRSMALIHGVMKQLD